MAIRPKADFPLISICIPTYNGFPYLVDLIEELLCSPRQDFEIVISDDCSNDPTWTYALEKSESDLRIKCVRNERNLGMDRNFAQSVAIATGEYVWLCGQDDKIFYQGLEAVAKLIGSFPELEFIYLNHIKVNEGDEIKDVSPTFSEAHAFGKGLNDFLRHHNFELPTFLPKFIIKKSLWDSVDIAPYFGTSYCQVGVFLEVSKSLKWCHLAGIYVVGLTPLNGWQANPLAYSRISLGLYVMVDRSSKKCPWFSEKMVGEVYKKSFKRAIYSIILIKALRLKIDHNLKQEFFRGLRPFPRMYMLVAGLYSVPSWIGQGLLHLIKVRRSIRRHINWALLK